jgi:hypothetical protein
MNLYSPIVRFFLARTLALQQGVSDQEASRLAVIAFVLRGPLGLVVPTIIARNEAPPIVTPPATGGVVPGPKAAALPAPAHEHKGKGGHHTS